MQGQTLVNVDTGKISHADRDTLKALSVLLSANEEERKEKPLGMIRTKQKCPKCDKPFELFERLGYICVEHQTVPRRLYFDFFHKGKRVRVYTDKQGMALDSYARALAVQETVMQAIKSHKFDLSHYLRSAQSKFWISNLLDEYEAYVLDELAPSYQKDVKRMLRIAKAHFGDKDVRDLRKKDIGVYKKHLQKMKKKFKKDDKAEKLSPKTVKNILDLFRSFLYYCQDEAEVIASFPAFPEVQYQEPELKWVSQQDQVKLYNLIQAEDRPISSIMMLHGCRPGEARAIKCKDVRLGTKTITIASTFSGKVYRAKRKGKKSRPVTIPIHKDMLPYITERLKVAGPEDYLFINPRTGGPYSANSLRRLWDRVRKIAKEQNVDLDDVRLYDVTRHTVGITLVQNGTPMKKVSVLLGHSNVRTTEKYARIEDIECLRVDLEKLSLKDPSMPEQSTGENGENEQAMLAGI